MGCDTLHQLAAAISELQEVTSAILKMEAPDVSKMSIPTDRATHCQTKDVYYLISQWLENLISHLDWYKRNFIKVFPTSMTITEVHKSTGRHIQTCM